ncbi:MAG: hypothetical protein ACJAZP_001350 [Psychromonas sp.]|jgi:hypothetical protein|uniref:DUF3466 family protein n=1 Tax=Psychromonas sp. TaxID=1884585 RepID=UPI0039E6157B
MRYKLPLTGLALLLSANSWAGDPYFSTEIISVTADDASYGPYPSAMSDDGTFLGTYSMKTSLSREIDLGLPFTFNRACQYDDAFCEVEFSGSETYGDLSYDNASQAWRNAQSDAEDSSYGTYMMGNSVVDGYSTEELPYDLGYYTTDIKVTDVTGDSGESQFVVGYSSAPYSSYERDFVRRAFFKYQGSDEVTSLLPEFYTDTGDDDASDANGGFSSAYKIKEVTIDSVTKTLVVGSGSISLPEDDDSDDVQEYFQNCFFSDEDDETSTINELVYCPGFDTQAWAWDVTDLTDTTQDIEGFELASEWLDDNDDNDGSDATYSASALDINASGIAVGVSTFEYSSAATGARQRAIIMTPYSDADGDDSYDTGDTVTYDTDGNPDYGAPIELTDAARDIEDASDEGDTIYNTWAIAITDTNIVIGNREYNVAKSVNKPTEFFIYDIDNDSISFPLEDKKVLTTEQRLAGDSSAKTGANSQAYDINESGLIVGKVDDYDQTDPVTGGSPRIQAAFLYDNDSGDSWYINDLICSEDTDGVVTSPYYKIRSARVISDMDADGLYYVLAEGWQYNNASDYTNETNSTEIMLKLTRNTAVSSPDDSPNCWDSDLMDTDDSYERSGAASFWLWIFALPVLLIRRFIK